MVRREPWPPGQGEMVGVNLKYLGPYAVHFDVRQKGWGEAIELAMVRYELVPVKETPNGGHSGNPADNVPAGNSRG
jgi:hypothetical protein